MTARQLEKRIVAGESLMASQRSMDEMIAKSTLGLIGSDSPTLKKLVDCAQIRANEKVYSGLHFHAERWIERKSLRKPDGLKEATAHNKGCNQFGVNVLGVRVGLQRGVVTYDEFSAPFAQTGHTPSR